MATPQPAKIIRAPGKMVWNPTANPSDDVDAYPYGGTELGAVKGIYLVPFDDGFTVWAEEYGEPADQLEPLRDWGIGFVARGWDDDVLPICFANTGEDTISQHTYVSLHGSQSPGMSALDDRGGKLLFVPENPIAAPGFIAYNAVAVLESNAAMHFAWSRDLEVPVVFRMFRDGSARIGFVRQLWDLSI